MTGDLYQADVLAWSEQQAELVRRAARGECVNGLDWENIAEEVESVGRSPLQACRSRVRQALVHLLKTRIWPAADAAPHWDGEIQNFLDQARDSFSPSMQHSIGLEQLYAQARRQVERALTDIDQPRSLPQECPVGIDALLADPPDLDSLIAAFAPPPD